MSDPTDGPWDDATSHDDGSPAHESDQMEGDDPPTTRATLAQQVRMRAASRGVSPAEHPARPSSSSTLPQPITPDRLPAQSSVHDHITPVALPTVMNTAIRKSRETGDGVIVLDKVARAPTPAPVGPERTETAAGGIVVVATGADAERVRKLCHANGLLVPVLTSLGAAHESAAAVVIGEPSLPASPQVAHVARTALPDAALLDLLRGLVSGRVVVDPPVAAPDADPRVADFAQRISSLVDRGAIEQVAVEAITVLTRADRARLLFFDSSTGALWSQAPSTFTTPRAAAGMVGWSAYTGRALHASPAGDDPRYLTELDDPEGKAQSRLLVQPVVGADRRTHAVLVAIRRWRHSDFSEAERVALSSLAALIAGAIDLAAAGGPHTTSGGDAPRRPRSTLPSGRAGIAPPATQSALLSAAPRSASDSRPPPVTARRPESKPPPIPSAAIASRTTATPAAGSIAATRAASHDDAPHAARAASQGSDRGSDASPPRAGATPAAGNVASIARAASHDDASARVAPQGSDRGGSDSSPPRAGAATPAVGNDTSPPRPRPPTSPSGVFNSPPHARPGSAPSDAFDSSPPRPRGESSPPRPRTESGGAARNRNPSDPPSRKSSGADGDPIDVAIVATGEDDIARIRRIARKARLEVSVLARAEDAPPYYRLVTLGEAWAADTDSRVAYAARSTISDDQLADLLVGLSRDRAPAALVASKPQSAAEAKRAQLGFASSRKLAQATDLAAAETLTIEAVRELLDADRVYCVYYSNEDGALWSETRRRARGDDRRAIAGVVGWSARTGRPVNVPRASADPRWLGPLDDPDGDMHSQLLVQPIIATDRRVIGVLVAARRTKRPPFNDLDVTLLERFAALASPLIEQLQLATVTQQMLRESSSSHDIPALDSPIQSLMRSLRSLPRWTYAVGGAVLMLIIVLLATC